MDIDAPNFDWAAAIRRFFSELPGVKVVALSEFSGKQFVRDVILAGASGFILKDSSPEEMIEGMRTVLSGFLYFSKTISNVLISDYKKLASETGQSLDGSQDPILRAKLHRPQINPNIVPRPRLALETQIQNPVTLIVAPAAVNRRADADPASAHEEPDSK